jgi:hypothetical protein
MTPLARDPVEYTFGADGILRRQADFECRWGWPRILGVEESPAAFILRLSDGRASDGPMLLVAKRGIVAPADESGLRALLGRYAPGRLPGAQSLRAVRDCRAGRTATSPATSLRSNVRSSA